MTHATFHQLAVVFWTSTSIKGVPRAIKSTSALTRLFWSISTVGCLAMLLWQTSTLLLKYYKYLVAINAYDANATPHFPSVMVCKQFPYEVLAGANPTYTEYLNILSEIRSKVGFDYMICYKDTMLC